MMRKPSNICKTVADAFVYDDYRHFTSPFKLRYIYHFLMGPAYFTIVLFRLHQYFYWKSKAKGLIISKLFTCFSNIAERLNFILNAGFETSPFVDVYKQNRYLAHNLGIISQATVKAIMERWL